MNDLRELHKAAKAEDLKFAELLRVLREDAEYARIELLDMPDDQPQKQSKLRSYVRTAFALIEGLSYAMRMRSVNYNSLPLATNLSPEEVDMLSEKERFLKFEDAIKEAFKAAAKQRGVEFKLDCNCSGWTALKAATKTRHRLTHPKQLDELTITPEQIGEVTAGMHWLYDESSRLMNSTSRAS